MIWIARDSKQIYTIFYTYNQISTANGFIKENSRVGFPLGILNRIEIPKFMKGLVKSITASRAKFIVIAPIAKSAVPSMSSVKYDLISNQTYMHDPSTTPGTIRHDSSMTQEWPWHTGANPSKIQIAQICRFYLTTIHPYDLLLTKIQKNPEYLVRVKNPDPDSGNFLTPSFIKSDFKGVFEVTFLDLKPQNRLYESQAHFPTIL